MSGTITSVPGGLFETVRRELRLRNYSPKVIKAHVILRKVERLHSPIERLMAADPDG